MNLKTEFEKLHEKQEDIRAMQRDAKRMEYSLIHFMGTHGMADFLKLDMARIRSAIYHGSLPTEFTD